MPTKVQNSPETVSDEDVKRHQDCIAQEREPEKAKECLADLAIKCGPRIMRYLLGRGHSIEDAEDILQETFVRACTYRESYDPQRRFYAWYFEIAKHIAFDRYQKAKKEARDESVSSDTDPTLPVMTAAASERFSQARLLYYQMRHRCDDDQKRKLDAYCFHYAYGYSWPTLCKRLNWHGTPRGFQKACDELVHRLLRELNEK